MNDTRTIIRGQIYYIKMDPDNKPVGSETWPERPAIIVSNEVNNKFANTVEIVYLTTKLNKSASPTHVRLRPANRPSIAMCEQIHTVDRSRLGDLIDTVNDIDMERIEQAMALSLGIADKNLHPANLFHKWELYINKHSLQLGLQLEKLFEKKPEKAEKTTANSAEIKKLKAQLQTVTRERDMHKTLYESAQRKLTATEEERDTYARLYKLSQTADDDLPAD